MKAKALRYRPTYNERRRQQRNRDRLALLEYMGNKCERCGFSDWRALQIDHINGGGVREQKEAPHLKNPMSYYLHIKARPELYQLLCANCNWIKRYERKEVAEVWGKKVVYNRRRPSRGGLHVD